jgi:hypothetical protein
MDFIVKLLLSKESMTGVIYNNILIINDRLTKYVYLILYLKASNATELIYIIVKVVIAQHGTLKEIISNRNKLFKL